MGVNKEKVELIILYLGPMCILLEMKILLKTNVPQKLYLDRVKEDLYLNLDKHQDLVIIKYHQNWKKAPHTILEIKENLWKHLMFLVQDHTLQDVKQIVHLLMQLEPQKEIQVEIMILLVQVFMIQDLRKKILELFLENQLD